MSNYPDNMNWEAYDRIYDPQPEEDYVPTLNFSRAPDPELEKALKEIEIKFTVERRKIRRAKTIWEMPAESVFCEWSKNYQSGEAS